MLKLSKYERNVCQFFVVCGTMFHKKKTIEWSNRETFTTTQRDFSFALTHTMFAIRTTRFSHPHQCVPSHALESTGL